LTAREKTAPRHRRENQLKEKNSPASGPRGAQSHLTERENCPAHRRATLVLFCFSFGTQKRTKLSAKAIYKYKKTFKFSS
jgi:hypothetical protein